MMLLYHTLTLARFREFLASGWRLAPGDADHPFLWFTPAPPVGLEMNELVLVLDLSASAGLLIKRGSRGYRTSAPHATLAVGPEAVERLLVADEHLVPGIQALVPSLRVIPLDQEAKVSLLDYARGPAAILDPESELCSGGGATCPAELHPWHEDGPARAHPAVVKGKPADIGPPHFFRSEPHAPNSRSVAKTDPSGYHGQHTPPGAKVQLAARERVVEAAFDTTIKNTDLVRTAAGLAAAAKRRPVNPGAIRRYVERLVYALEVSVLAVLERADAMRFSSLIRGALASLEDALSAEDMRGESVERDAVVQKSLAQLRVLVIECASELVRDGQTPRRGGGGLRSPRGPEPRARGHRRILPGDAGLGGG